MSVPPALDPRPATQVADDGRYVVAGGRCRRCHEAHAFRWPRCATCGGELETASFGPGGTVWSSTVVRIAVPGRTPPYGLAYVDLDDGPRVLAHVAPTGDDAVAPVRVGSSVRLTAPFPAGDLTVEPQVVEPQP